MNTVDLNQANLRTALELAIRSGEPVHLLLNGRVIAQLTPVDHDELAAEAWAREPDQLQTRGEQGSPDLPDRLPSDDELKRLMGFDQDGETT